MKYSLTKEDKTIIKKANLRNNFIFENFTSEMKQALNTVSLVYFNSGFLIKPTYEEVVNFCRFNLEPSYEQIIRFIMQVTVRRKFINDLKEKEH